MNGEWMGASEAWKAMGGVGHQTGIYRKAGIKRRKRNGKVEFFVPANGATTKDTPYSSFPTTEATVKSQFVPANGYEVWIATLKAKREKIDAAIEALESL